MKNIKSVGDEVYLDSYTSMGQSSLAQGVYPNTIEKVEFRYDEYTGEKFPVYLVLDAWYDGRNGNCYSNKNSIYYLEL